MFLTLFAFALPDTFFPGIVASFVYGVIAIVFLIAGYKIFDWVCPLDFNKELGENKNMAVAVVIAAFLLGIAYVIAHIVN